MRLYFPTSQMPPQTGDRRRCAPLALLLLASLALTACSSVREQLPTVSTLVSPYKIDVLQGNVVTREQAQALQPGMSRDQVRGMLGSPLLASVFHADRWDYVFTFRRQGQPSQQRRLTVFFKGEAMERIESDELPSETEFVSSLDSRRKNAKTPTLEASEEQLKAFQSRQTPGPAAAPTPVAPPTVYPPLEPAGASR
jgi:outer membrane protein assembly factor BamE